MPSFLPPAAASSEVLRTLNEQNEAQKALEACAADVDIALEEIKGVRVAAESQAQAVKEVQGQRSLLEDQLSALQYFAAALAEAAVQKEAAVKAHTGLVHAEEESLKAKQKDVINAEAAVGTAHESRDRAEAKLANAKAEHEKALTRAKAAGIVPELPSAEPEKTPKSVEKRRSRERDRRSRSRSPVRRRSVRSRSKDRESRRSRSRDRRAIRGSPHRRRTPPMSWRDRERDRGRFRDRGRDRRSPLRRPSPPRRRSRSRGRRSRSPERRRRSLESPPRGKRGRSRSHDSKDAKRGRVSSSEKAERDQKNSSVKNLDNQSDRRKQVDGSPHMKGKKPSTDDMQEQGRSESPPRQKPANGLHNTHAGEDERSIEDLRTRALEAANLDLPLPPPPARPEQDAEPGSAVGAGSKATENGDGNPALEEGAKVDKPKKEKKDKEAKKHKKEKKEKKESKKGKNKEKEAPDKSVSPAHNSPLVQSSAAAES